jgi:dolichol-phosphate mannosyltransferase
VETELVSARTAVEASQAAALPRADRAFVPARPVVFVVPAYDEADNIPRLFADLESHPQLFSPASRVIVVDDGSTDGTPDVVGAYDGWLPVELVRLPENQGPGAAFRTGFHAALNGCDEDTLVVTLEADTTSDLSVLPRMLELASEGHDLVLASVHGGGQMVNVGLLRRVLSKGAGVVVRAALGLDARTVSSFFRVYRASVLRRAFARHGDDLIREPGFACKAELLAKIAALGASIVEVPVDLDASRRVGKSKMRIGPTLHAYWRLMRQQREDEEQPVEAVPQSEAMPA